MTRHANVAIAAAFTLLLIAATATDLRWDYAVPFRAGLPSPQSHQNAERPAVVAMVDDSSFDATVAAYGLNSLQRPNFDEHVLVYVTMVYGSCAPSPEGVSLEGGDVLIHLTAIDPDAVCPQAMGVIDGAVRLWRADLPAGEVPVRVARADGTVWVEGTIPNGPALAATGTRPKPLATTAVGMLALGFALLRTTPRPPYPHVGRAGGDT